MCCRRRFALCAALLLWFAMLPLRARAAEPPAPAPTLPAMKEAVLVMPLQAGAGITPTSGDDWLGEAVYHIIHQTLLPDGRLAEPSPEGSWLYENFTILFPSSDDHARYRQTKSPALPAADVLQKIGVRYVLTGTLQKTSSGGLTTQLHWLDRKTGKKAERTASVDCPGLTGFREAVIALETEGTGFTPPSAELRARMLWRENLPFAQLRLLTVRSEKSHDKAVVALKEGVKTMPDSYLLWNEYGWVLAEDRRSDTSQLLGAFSKALSLNPTGVDAIAGIGYRYEQLNGSQIWAAEWYLLRGETAAIARLETAPFEVGYSGGKDLVRRGGSPFEIGMSVPRGLTKDNGNTVSVASIVGIYSRTAAATQDVAALELLYKISKTPPVALALADAYRTARRWMDAEKSYYAAVDGAQQARIFKETEAAAWNGLGITYRALRKYDLSQAAFDKAFALHAQAKNAAGQAESRNGRGLTFAAHSQWDRAFADFSEAETLAQKADDKAGLAATHANLGLVYAALNRHADAVRELRAALALRDSADPMAAGEVATLRLSLSTSLLETKEAGEAAPLVEQVVSYAKTAGDKSLLCAGYKARGNLFRDANRLAHANAAYKDALVLARETGNQTIEASLLHDLGTCAYLDKKYEAAFDFNAQALPLRRLVGDRQGEGLTLNNLMFICRALHQNALAIYYGKAAVNVYGAIRGEIAALNTGKLEAAGTTERGYVVLRADTYHVLADLLLEAGRFGEAEQVIRLLKVQEMTDFVRGGETGTRGTVELDALEQKVDAAIRAGAKNTTPTNTAQLLTDLSVLSAANAARVGGTFPVKEMETVATPLKRLARETGRVPIAVYALVGDNSLRLLVYGPDGTARSHVSAVGRTDLRRMVLGFRQTLTDPTLDPRPRAKILYDLLVKPIENDLAAFHATEVMWSLDDCLRYIPLAALSPDGKTYLVERTIRHVLFTPANLSTGTLTFAPAPTWRVLALGVSEESTVGKDHFNALPGVQNEIDGILGKSGGADGIYPGTRFVNADFSRDRFVAALAPPTPSTNGSFSVVHIASHFVFRPGDETRSYLLLGGSRSLSVAELRSLNTNLFADVDLLTLSACETAVGDGASAADGAEVESFAVWSGRMGAASVLATLWPVNDTSTAPLLTAFYRERRTHPELPKTEALRRAQMALLQGKQLPTTTETPAQKASRTANGNAAPPPQTEPDAPHFPFDAARPWAHPYFWSPFELFGNWR